MQLTCIYDWREYVTKDTKTTVNISSTYEYLGLSNNKEAGRNGWHLVIENVRNSLVGRTGRHLTYKGMQPNT